MKNPLSAIPASAQLLIADFFLNDGTGQIALNFHEGKVKSWDCRRHEKATGPFCSKCGLPVHRNNGGWGYQKGAVLCGECS